jgi:hypothetical protein
VGEETATNPYMRIVTSKSACAKLALAMHAVTGDATFKDGKADHVSVLGELRRCRDESVIKVNTS